jgi:hypothetical protein
MKKTKTNSIKSLLKKAMNGLEFDSREYEWMCYMFGGNIEEGIVWSVYKPPCWFWRQMQYLLVGNRWVRNPQFKLIKEKK